LKDDPPILIAAHNDADARFVASVLAAEFHNVHLSTKPENAAADFEKHLPAIVILSFERVEAAQRYYGGLYRSSKIVHTVPHRTIVLCGRPELRRVYELCRTGHFDDYVLFWPTTHDAPRLAMAVHHGMSLIATASAEAVTPGQLAAQARHIAGLEPQLAEFARRFAQEVDRTSAAATATEQMAGGAFRRRFGTLGESVDALCRAAQELALAMGPQLQAARTMRELAARVRPSVLAVDDDAFQRTLLRQFLADARIDLTCASSGAQALAALWKARPDLVLMDVDLPDLDGVEVTRRLKSLHAFADIPVIIITGHSQRSVVMESLKAGAVDFMVKPLIRATLIEKLEAYVPGSVG
jgi:CheY-like chemotaxis protein